MEGCEWEHANGPPREEARAARCSDWCTLLSKRNTSHTQTHDKNNTTNDHTKSVKKVSGLTLNPQKHKLYLSRPVRRWPRVNPEVCEQRGVNGRV